MIIIFSLNLVFLRQVQRTPPQAGFRQETLGPVSNALTIWPYPCDFAKASCFFFLHMPTETVGGYNFLQFLFLQKIELVVNEVYEALWDDEGFKQWLLGIQRIFVKDSPRKVEVTNEKKCSLPYPYVKFSPKIPHLERRALKPQPIFCGLPASPTFKVVSFENASRV